MGHPFSPVKVLPDGGHVIAADPENHLLMVALHGRLQDLVSLILGSAVPIGPMRSRKDYPSELAGAIELLKHIAEKPSKPLREADEFLSDSNPLFGYGDRSPYEKP